MWPNDSVKINQSLLPCKFSKSVLKCPNRMISFFYHSNHFQETFQNDQPIQPVRRDFYIRNLLRKTFLAEEVMIHKVTSYSVCLFSLILNTLMISASNVEQCSSLLLEHFTNFQSKSTKVSQKMENLKAISHREPCVEWERCVEWYGSRKN